MRERWAGIGFYPDGIEAGGEVSALLIGAGPYQLEGSGCGVISGGLEDALTEDVMDCDGDGTRCFHHIGNRDL